MNVPYIFTSGIIVVIIFLVGLFYTFKEFKEMEQHPDDYTRRHDGATASHKEKKKID